MQKFDVLIVGAGMVGLTLALALRKQGNLQVALVDTLELSPVTDNPEVRVSAINMASKTIFENLSVWDDIEASRTMAYQHMHVWDKAGIGELNFSVSDLGNTVSSQCNKAGLGWIIENNIIRKALFEKASLDSSITFFTQQKLSSLTTGDSEVFATFCEPSEQFPSRQLPILSKLVVGADGANSWVRKQADIGLTFKDYDHHAIVATVKCSQGHQNTAWQVFLPTGPLAFLPLCSSLGDLTTCSIVYSTSPEDAERLISLTADDFSKELTAATDGKLGTIDVVSERFTYPLKMRLAQNFVKERIVLVGDAAHTIHPLAGQGVNLGLLDAVSLSQILTEQLNSVHSNDSSQHHDIAEPQSLNSYARWRKSEATDMIAAMEAIKQTFMVKNDGISLIRGIGMRLVDGFKPLKKLLIKQALGFKSSLPLLAIKSHDENVS
ncbi:MAG: FAD-dependent monooxygenase [Colwellia sp.]